MTSRELTEVTVEANQMLSELGIDARAIHDGEFIVFISETYDFPGDLFLDGAYEWNADDIRDYVIGEIELMERV